MLYVPRVIPEKTNTGCWGHTFRKHAGNLLNIYYLARDWGFKIRDSELKIQDSKRKV